MATPTSSETFDPADIVTFIVETACGMLEILARKYGLTEPLMLRVFRRLRRLGARFAKLAAQIAAGELPDTAPPRRCAVPRRADASRVRSPDALSNRGWLRDLAPETDCFLNTFNWMFSLPSVKALIAAAPQQVGRVLRPLCWMVAADLPTALRLPRRARPRPVQETSAPAPEPERPADHDGRPQWRAPEPLSDPEDASWKMHPPERPPKNRD